MIILGLWLAIGGYTVLYLGWTSWSAPVGTAGPSLACIIQNRQVRKVSPTGSTYVTCGPSSASSSAGKTPSGSSIPTGPYPAGQLSPGPTAAQLNAIHRQTVP